jgi:hypothetical protein
MRYRTGEEIQLRDRVNYEGLFLSVEQVIEGLTGKPDEDWLFTESGPGIMLQDVKVFGRLYLCDPQEVDRLVFLGRVDETP